MRTLWLLVIAACAIALIITVFGEWRGIDVP